MKKSPNSEKDANERKKIINKCTGCKDFDFYLNSKTAGSPVAGSR